MSNEDMNWKAIDRATTEADEITTLRKDLAEARAENERLQSALEKLTRDAGKVHRLGAVPGNQWPPLACSLIEARATMADILAKQAAHPVLRPPTRKAKGETA